MMRRRFLLSPGVLTLAAAWLALPEMARTSFSAHMTMHMTVVAVAAPLLALGIASTPFDPVFKAPGFFAPLPISLLELVLVWMWHVPVFHHAARGSAFLMAAEQGTFLIAGLLLWLSAFGGNAMFGGPRAAAGVAGLLLTSMHMTLLGALLALAPRALYAHSHGGGALSPLADQQLGGAIMLIVGGCSYLAGALYLMVGLLRPREKHS